MDTREKKRMFSVSVDTFYFSLERISFIQENLDKYIEVNELVSGGGGVRSDEMF